MKDNKIVVDLSKVQWARFGYRNQDGNFRDTIPDWPTVHGQSFDITAVALGDTSLTMVEYADKYKLLDHWIAEVKFKVTANCILVYTGRKAVSLFKAFCAKQFKKGKK